MSMHVCTFNFQELLLVFAYFLLVIVPKAVLASEYGGQQPHAAISKKAGQHLCHHVTPGLQPLDGTKWSHPYL